jgi:hypothetical protein
MSDDISIWQVKSTSRAPDFGQKILSTYINEHITMLCGISWTAVIGLYTSATSEGSVPTPSHFMVSRCQKSTLNSVWCLLIGIIWINRLADKTEDHSGPTQADWIGIGLIPLETTRKVMRNVVVHVRQRVHENGGHVKGEVFRVLVLYLLKLFFCIVCKYFRYLLNWSLYLKCKCDRYFSTIPCVCEYTKKPVGLVKAKIIW